MQETPIVRITDADGAVGAGPSSQQIVTEAV